LGVSSAIANIALPLNEVDIQANGILSAKIELSS